VWWVWRFLKLEVEARSGLAIRRAESIGELPYGKEVPLNSDGQRVLASFKLPDVDNA
jgi:hypothetical protein